MRRLISHVVILVQLVLYTLLDSAAVEKQVNAHQRLRSSCCQSIVTLLWKYMCSLHIIYLDAIIYVNMDDLIINYLITLC